MKSSYYRKIKKGTLVKEGYRKGKIVKVFGKSGGVLKGAVVVQFKRGWVIGKLTHLKKDGYKFGK
jgi:hypothetical protein